MIFSMKRRALDQPGDPRQGLQVQAVLLAVAHEEEHHLGGLAVEGVELQAARERATVMTRSGTSSVKQCGMAIPFPTAVLWMFSRSMSFANTSLLVADEALGRRRVNDPPQRILAALLREVGEETVRADVAASVSSTWLE